MKYKYAKFHNIKVLFLIIAFSILKELTVEKWRMVKSRSYSRSALGREKGSWALSPLCFLMFLWKGGVSYDDFNPPNCIWHYYVLCTILSAGNAFPRELYGLLMRWWLSLTPSCRPGNWGSQHSAAKATVSVQAHLSIDTQLQSPQGKSARGDVRKACKWQDPRWFLPHLDLELVVLDKAEEGCQRSNQRSSVLNNPVGGRITLSLCCESCLTPVWEQRAET